MVEALTVSETEIEGIPSLIDDLSQTIDKKSSDRASLRKSPISHKKEKTKKKKGKKKKTVEKAEELKEPTKESKKEKSRKNTKNKKKKSEKKSSSEKDSSDEGSENSNHINITYTREKQLAAYRSSTSEVHSNESQHQFYRTSKETHLGLLTETDHVLIDYVSGDKQLSMQYDRIEQVSQKTSTSNYESLDQAIHIDAATRETKTIEEKTVRYQSVDQSTEAITIAHSQDSSLESTVVEYSSSQSVSVVSTDIATHTDQGESHLYQQQNQQSENVQASDAAPYSGSSSQASANEQVHAETTTAPTQDLSLEQAAAAYTASDSSALSSSDPLVLATEEPAASHYQAGAESTTTAAPTQDFTLEQAAIAYTNSDTIDIASFDSALQVTEQQIETQYQANTEGTTITAPSQDLTLEQAATAYTNSATFDLANFDSALEATEHLRDSNQGVQVSQELEQITQKEAVQYQTGQTSQQAETQTVVQDSQQQNERYSSGSNNLEQITVAPSGDKEIQSVQNKTASANVEVQKESNYRSSEAASNASETTPVYRDSQSQTTAAQSSYRESSSSIDQVTGSTPYTRESSGSPESGYKSQSSSYTQTETSTSSSTVEVVTSIDEVTDKAQDNYSAEPSLGEHGHNGQDDGPMYNGGEGDHPYDGGCGCGACATAGSSPVVSMTEEGEKAYTSATEFSNTSHNSDNGQPDSGGDYSADALADIFNIDIGANVDDAKKDADLCGCGCGTEVYKSLEPMQ